MKQSAAIQWLTTSRGWYILPDTQNHKMLRVRRDFKIFYFQPLTFYPGNRVAETCSKLKSESQKTNRTFWQMKIVLMLWMLCLMYSVFSYFMKEFWFLWVLCVICISYTFLLYPMLQKVSGSHSYKIKWIFDLHFVSLQIFGYITATCWWVYLFFSYKKSPPGKLCLLLMSCSSPPQYH